MKQIVLFLVVLYCVCVQAAFNPSEARRVYRTSGDTKSPVVEAGDFVFLRVEWKVGSDEDDADIAELEAIDSAIKGYLFSGSQHGAEEIAQYKYSDLQSTVVKETMTGKTRCQVLAFDAKQLKEERQKVCPPESSRAIWTRFFFFWETKWNF